MVIQNQKSKIKSNRRRNQAKTTSSGFSNKKEKHAKKKKIQKKKITTKFFNNNLSHIPYYIGVYAQDQLLSLRISNYPVSCIVNLDTSSQQGSHWIAIYITKNSFEVWCSLGFRPTSWDRFPDTLIHFMSHYAHSHTFKISPELQTDTSVLCGLYTMFFIANRSDSTFTRLVHYFTADLSKNDLLLLDYFNK